jgi:hypothetical protein
MFDFTGGWRGSQPVYDIGAQTAEQARDAARRLEDRVNRLTLINMALWSLLKERVKLTDEELSQRVQELDLSDGHLDGKVHVTVRVCPQCGRNLSQKHVRCLYCGFEPSDQDAFAGVAR